MSHTAASRGKTGGFLLLLLLFFCTACRENVMKTPSPPKPLYCTGCHALELDANHRLACTSCHQGSEPAMDKENAHAQLVAQPAHPDTMETACGPCHAEQVAMVAKSSHFTLAASTNSFRKTFGASEEITNFREVKERQNPEDTLGLADDLLRRRCFHCHPFTSGDDYPAVHRGVGCSACHLPFTEGRLHSHGFQKPQDRQCLSCHYGNYVGFDYYGRFEHDYNVEYRTPYTTKEDHFRPYGVEYHQLVPDIHQQNGLVCIDCHSGSELMGRRKVRPSCAACHATSALAENLPPRVEKAGNTYTLRTSDGRLHPIPQLQYPAHFETRENIACQVCHAQWTFNDIGKHFLRSDEEDVDPWTPLAIQGSSEVENLVENNSSMEKTELPAAMTDKISGTSRPGIWYRGFTMRRWEEPVLGRDADGTITTLRPLLDYLLSWVDSEGKIRFNSISAGDEKGGWRPYTPHTTGPAGIFYGKRIDQFLEKERKQHQDEIHPPDP